MDLNDYDKTDMDYNNLVTGKDCQEKWHMAPGLDPLLVEEGERFLATKSTMPKGSKPIVAPQVSYYDVGGISTIDYIKAKLTKEQYKGYLLGNILKYSSRLQYKGDAKSDSKKLTEYSKWLEESLS